MAQVHSMHIREVTHRITMRVRGLKGWSARLWIARKMFVFGAWVAGVNIIIES